VRFPNRSAVRKLFEAVEPAIYFKFCRFVDQKSTVGKSRFQNLCALFSSSAKL